MDDDICHVVLSIPTFQRAKTVFAYLSVGDEVDTRALIRECWADDKRVAIPRCVSTAKQGKPLMEWYEITSFEGLETSGFGVEEPVQEPERRVFPQDDPNAVAIVPGFAFDAEGFRIGYGGGFYDVFLGEFAGTSIGLCRSPFFDTREIPKDAHDIPVNMVATDNFAVIVS